MRVDIWCVERAYVQDCRSLRSRDRRTESFSVSPPPRVEGLDTHKYRTRLKTLKLAGSPCPDHPEMRAGKARCAIRSDVDLLTPDCFDAMSDGICKLL